MAKTKFTDKDHLEHFEKQLALRDTYVKENADYIETKRDEIGLSTSETLAELCFALHMEDEIDDDGKSWLLNYMSGRIYSIIFNEEDLMDDFPSYKAILESLENGMIKGVSPKNVSPNSYYIPHTSLRHMN